MHALGGERENHVHRGTGAVRPTPWMARGAMLPASPERQVVGLAAISHQAALSGAERRRKPRSASRRQDVGASMRSAGDGRPASQRVGARIAPERERVSSAPTAAVGSHARSVRMRFEFSTARRRLPRRHTESLRVIATAGAGVGRISSRIDRELTVIADRVTSCVTAANRYAGDGIGDVISSSAHGRARAGRGVPKRKSTSAIVSTSRVSCAEAKCAK